MNKVVKTVLLVVLFLFVVWSAMAAIDYSRSKDLKPPLFATEFALNQHGAGVYRGIGYDVWADSKAFNGKEHVLYDMRFILFGRGKGGKKTISDNYNHNYGLMGMDKEGVFKYLEALEFIKPDASGKQEIYSEYVEGNDAKVMNLIFYNGIVSGFEYEYHNLEAAYNYAKKLRKDLEMTYGEKTTYPQMSVTNKDYFDSLNDISEIKAQHTYYEDWHAAFDYQKKENIAKMLEEIDYSRIDIRFELSVVDENMAKVSVKYLALP